MHIPISNPHSSAFVDIDGDCLNDMLILSNMTTVKEDNTTVTKTYLEIWRGIKEDNEIKYCLTESSVYEVHPSLGLFSIADIDRDSMLDIIFPVITAKPAKILIALNRIKLEYDWTQDYCENHAQLDATTNFKIPAAFDDLILDRNTDFVTTVTITDNNDEMFYSSKHTPTFLRFGDINSDSYEDFTTVLFDTKAYSQNVYVFLNSAVPKSDYKRTFYYNNTYTTPSVVNAIYSSFLDIEENGRLDLIIACQLNENIINTAGFWNGYNYDAFYLKSLVINQEKKFFANEIGTASRFITTNIDGSRRMDLAVQAIQASTPLSLNLPYSYIGIGRSNNYIENYCVISGVYILPQDNYKVFTPVIPNSQLIITHIRNIENPNKNTNITNSTVTFDYLDFSGILTNDET